MSDHNQTETVASADAAGGQFAKAFLPGLVLGLVLGLFIGAWLPPFFGGKPDLIPASPAGPRTTEDRYNSEAGGGSSQTPTETPGETPADPANQPEQPAPTPG